MDVNDLHNDYSFSPISDFGWLTCSPSPSPEIPLVLCFEPFLNEWVVSESVAPTGNCHPGMPRPFPIRCRLQFAEWTRGAAAVGERLAVSAVSGFVPG